MGYIIAVAGKGGSGKTTVAAILMGFLIRQRKGTVLGIDADPNSNLAEALGLKVKEDIGSIVDSIAARAGGIPVGMSKDAFIDFRIQGSIIEEKGFDLLTMGRPEGPGCYCYVNNLLRGMIQKIADDYDYVVIDNEAGLEHLSRRTMRQADVILVLSDASAAGLRAAGRIVGLISELKIEVKKMYLVLNRCNKLPSADKLKEAGIEVAGLIPEDEHLLDLSQRGKPLSCLSETAEAFISIEKLFKKVL